MCTPCLLKSFERDEKVLAADKVEYMKLPELILKRSFDMVRPIFETISNFYLSNFTYNNQQEQEDNDNDKG